MEVIDLKQGKRMIGRIHGTYATQAISSPDKRDAKTNAAIPSDDNVEAGKAWVDENKK